MSASDEEVGRLAAALYYNLTTYRAVGEQAWARFDYRDRLQADVVKDVETATKPYAEAIGRMIRLLLAECTTSTSEPSIKSVVQS